MDATRGGVESNCSDSRYETRRTRRLSSTHSDRVELLSVLLERRLQLDFIFVVRKGKTMLPPRGVRDDIGWLWQYRLLGLLGSRRRDHFLQSPPSRSDDAGIDECANNQHWNDLEASVR